LSVVRAIVICPDPPNPGDFAVSVTPDDSVVAWPENTSGHTARFIVKNVGICIDQYTMSYSTSGPVTGVSLDQSSFGLSPGQSKTVNATVSVGTAGSGALFVTASGHASNAGNYNITVTPPPYRVAVTPDGSTTPNRLANTAYIDTFTVQNTGTTTDTFALTCTSSSNITCGALLPAGPLPLASNALQKVAANYTTGSPGAGLLKLRAASSHSNDSGSYNVPIILRAAAVRAELPER
jgi:hypothetical protein